jgi:tRNA wybutosine-synthesizing protein 1
MAEVSKSLKKLLEKQQYGFSGKHSAVKICTWTKKSIRDEGICYKEKFYGIRCHLCCQMTPSVGYCQNRCIFCWREMEHTIGTSMDEPFDDPKEIIDNCILKQRKLLSGFGGTKKTNLTKLKAAQEPMHFAISLTGEPTLYPKLNELIKEIHSRGKTSFLVSNGMQPEVIRNIEPPTQLYISVDAPNKELFDKIDATVVKDGWDTLNKTLEVLKEIKNKTRTTLRFTMIKGMNMTDPEGWAERINISEPLFIEVKAYMFVGSSRMRLNMENMPMHHEVKEFAEEICHFCDYKIIDEKEESRVVLLTKEDFDGRIMQFD